MAFTYGFYDSLNGDRRYKASQFNELIGSLLTDGVFENIGSKLFVTAGTDMKINVGSGKAWFNNTWSVNDSVMVLNVPQSDITRPRYDTVVLDVNSDLGTRENKIMIVSGTPAVNPTKPILVNAGSHHQHPLAHILVPAAATSITASNIEIVVGQTACPFVTGILQTTDITGLYNKWEADFNTWFNNLQTQLTDDVVTNLQNQINQLGSEVETNYLKKADKASQSEVLTGTNNTKYVTPASMAGVTGKIIDADTGALIQLRGEVVGQNTYKEMITESSTIAALTGSILGYFVDDSSNKMYALITQGNGAVYMVWGSVSTTSRKNGAITISSQKYGSVQTDLGSANAYLLVNYYSPNNSIIQIGATGAFDTKTSIFYPVDGNAGSWYGTENYRFKFAFSNYSITVFYQGRTSTSNSVTSKMILSSVADFIVCGNSGDQLYAIYEPYGNQSNGTPHSSSGVIFNIPNSSTSTGWLTFPSTLPCRANFIYCDGERIFLLVVDKVTGNFPNKILIYNMNSATSNMASIECNVTNLYKRENEAGMVNVNSQIRYIGTSGTKSYFIILTPNSYQKDYFFKFDTETGSYEYKELTFLGGMPAIFLSKYGYKITIHSDALLDQKYIMHDGYLINLSEGSIAPAYGVVPQRYVQIGDSRYNPTLATWPAYTYVRDRTSDGESYYHKRIRRTGSINRSKFLAVDTLNSRTCHIIGGTLAKVYTTFAYNE